MKKISQSISYYTAIEENDMGTIMELLDLQINPNVINKDMKSPLDYAIFLNKWDIIKVLANHNAKVYCPTLHSKYEVLN